MYKSQGQVPITQILALFVTNFQHVSFILLLLPARQTLVVVIERLTTAV